MRTEKDILKRLASLNPLDPDPKMVLELIAEAKAHTEPKKPSRGHEARAARVAQQKREAAHFNEKLLEHVDRIDPEGAKTWSELAVALNELGIHSSSGRPWSHSNLYRQLSQSLSR